MAITASQVNELRKITGAGMLDCKNALTETNGDMDAAIDNLRKKGQKISDKRADRESNEGVVMALTNAEGTKGIVVEVNCETDFVAKNAEFIAFAQSIADVALAQLPVDKAALLELSLNGLSVKDRLLDQMAKIGEKIEVSNYELLQGANVVSYIHAGNKIGVLVSLNQAGTKAAAAGRDAAMQIAAMRPLAVSKEGIPQSVIDRELDIAREQVRAEGKPENMVDKIAQGKLGKFFKENTLLSQSFVKDASKTVEQMLQDADKGLTVENFKRLGIGV
ncbi:MAG: elongation factor Ts [Bacteroidetes bacterium]|jgi:elongation factor Ts|nr:elongation factor Ts [Bacteroidota bacterium]